MASKSNTSKRSSGKTLAQRADKHALYLESVQEPSVEVDFFKQRFRHYYGRPARVLREDFCGSAAICYEWVRRRPECHAIGVDLDGRVLDWGRKHLATGLSEQDRARVTLLREDVRHVIDRKADVIAAQNFSFWIFTTRDELRGYFEAVKANLAGEGLFVLDMMGGSEALEDERVEESKKDGFTYVWDQVYFDPITHRCKFHIHFKFKDGSRIERAFTYEWRMWTIPEVCDLLREVGFPTVDVYWEGSDANGDGDGIFRKRTRGTADPAWIAYIVAAK